MQPKIVPQPALRLVGLEIRTQPMSPEIPALWRRFAARLSEIAGATEPGVALGAMRNEPDRRSSTSPACPWPPMRWFPPA
jgi:predicted transcriptional regulator YdeE